MYNYPGNYESAEPNIRSFLVAIQIVDTYIF